MHMHKKLLAAVLIIAIALAIILALVYYGLKQATKIPEYAEVTSVTSSRELPPGELD